MAITKLANGAEKATFEYQNETHEVYWNGKKYAGNTIYTTVDSRTKVSISDKNGIQYPSHVPGAFAKAALRALDIID